MSRTIRDIIRNQEILTLPPEGIVTLMGEREVQVLARAQAAIPALVGARRTPSALAVRSLEPALWKRPNNGSRMMREYHVRF